MFVCDNLFLLLLNKGKAVSNNTINATNDLIEAIYDNALYNYELIIEEDIKEYFDEGLSKGMNKSNIYWCILKGNEKAINSIVNNIHDMMQGDFDQTTLSCRLEDIRLWNEKRILNFKYYQDKLKELKNYPIIEGITQDINNI